MKSKLLVSELWALGDLVLAAPFLGAASRLFQVTLLAKPAALELRPRFFPDVEIIPFNFPWTRFTGKYRLYDWPWSDLSGVVASLRSHRFDIAASARCDARDHLVLRFSGAKRRIGFPHYGSGVFLTDALAHPAVDAHRYENWRGLAGHLGVDLHGAIDFAAPANGRSDILVHTGAAQFPRVWPLDRFEYLVLELRRSQYDVQVACDPSQRAWWTTRGHHVSTPASLSELIAILDRSALFIGNDSGPGHLAAMLGVPTFTLFGNQFPARFIPLHSEAEWMEGGPCPYKPCYDSCRFASPECLLAIKQDEVLSRVRRFVAKHLDQNEPQFRT